MRHLAIQGAILNLLERLESQVPVTARKQFWSWEGGRGAPRAAVQGVRGLLRVGTPEIHS